jgi:predicted nucleic acid-binding protein
MVFTDSNIWLYALIKGQDVVKSGISNQLIDQNAGNLALSSQVVVEVVANLIKKSTLEEAQFRELITGLYRDYKVVDVSEVIMRSASELREHYSFSYWDSLIVSAGLYSGASVLYSEDMQDGLVVNGQLTIVNPFKR